MDSGRQTVGSDVPDEKNNGLVLRPVEIGESGEGLPYAPINWPNPGDNWGWRAGTRVNASGFMQDRYLYPPRHLGKNLKGGYILKSQVTVREYIINQFPDADVDAFFASFSWKMPVRNHNSATEDGTSISIMHRRKKKAEVTLLRSESKVRKTNCKIGNESCSRQQATSNLLPSMECDICCSEDGFCRYCCCILCCKTIDLAHGGYSFIRCQARSNEDPDFVCGHVGHLDCALRSYVAGTNGGSIGVDAEYYCRRCDKRRNLIPHVENFLRTCESLDSREEIEKILNMGLCILYGSQKEKAKRLLDQISLLLAKLRDGTCLDEIWNVEDNISEISAGSEEVANNRLSEDCTSHLEPANVQPEHHGPLLISAEDQSGILKLENEIDKVLEDLKSSQDDEYKVAERKLKTQKDRLVGLYQHLDTERSNLAIETSLSTTENGFDNLLGDVLGTVDRIKEEAVKLKDMEEVAKGFGRVHKEILETHFDLQIED